MNLKEIKELIELINEKGFTDFEIERQGFRMRVSRATTNSLAAAAPPAITPAPAAAPALPEAPAPQLPAAQPAAPEPKESADAALQIIKSPIVGTFYRAPSPTSDPFVRVGDRVEPDSVVCIIEAMKLMNEIQAEVAGEIAKIFVENGQPVEYGQPLFGVRA